MQQQEQAVALPLYQIRVFVCQYPVGYDSFNKLFRGWLEHKEFEGIFIPLYISNIRNAQAYYHLVNDGLDTHVSESNSLPQFMLLHVVAKGDCWEAQEKVIPEVWLILRYQYSVEVYTFPINVWRVVIVGMHLIICSHVHHEA